MADTMTTDTRTAPSPTATERDVCERFVETLAARDFPSLASCFSDDARFRALVPSGPKEADGPTDAAAYFHRWFAAYDRFDIVEGHAEHIADRRHLTWRFSVSAPDSSRLVEQHAFATVEDNRIVLMDVLCSGFRPERELTPPNAVLDGGDAGCATLTPLVRARLRELNSGDVLELVASDPGAAADLASWSNLTGNPLIGVRDEGARRRYFIRKK